MTMHRVSSSAPARSRRQSQRHLRRVGDAGGSNLSSGCRTGPGDGHHRAPRAAADRLYRDAGRAVRSTDGGDRWGVWRFRARRSGVVDPRSSRRSATALRRHIAGGCVPQRRRRRHLRRLPNAVQPERVKMPFACRSCAWPPIRHDRRRCGPRSSGRRHAERRRRGATWTLQRRPLETAERAPKSKIVSDNRHRGHARRPRAWRQRCGARHRLRRAPHGTLRSAAGAEAGRTWSRPLLAAHLRTRHPRVAARPADALRILSPPRAARMARCIAAATRATWTRFDRGVKAESTMMGLALHPRDPERAYCVSRTGRCSARRTAARLARDRLPTGVLDVYAIACA